MYNFTLMFAVRLVSPGKKVLPIDAAISMWEILIGSRCKFFTQWGTFLKAMEAKNSQFAINQDNWNLFLQLVDQTGGTWVNFEDDGSWSTLIDEFGEHMKAFKK